jgi:poly-gamma-glutamate synthesis protein (capsule biosynthesis protein)
VASAFVERVAREVGSLKQEANFVIVAFHWGREYTHDPTDRQVELAHAAVDAGADLVIGSHPHWVQGIELYKGKLITYSLGNFVFDQMWSQETREGVIAKYVFDEDGLAAVTFQPVIIEDYSQPRLATKEEARTTLAAMKRSTLRMISAAKWRVDRVDLSALTDSGSTRRGLGPLDPRY